MNNPIEKSEQISPEDATGLILSFGDVNLVSSLFERNGWTLSEEIRETLIIARQNQNLGAKLSALKYLRQLVKETMETSGMVAKVSRTIVDGEGVTTFSAKRIATALNPTKKTESKEIPNVEQEQHTETEEIDAGGCSEQEAGGRLGGSAGTDPGRDSDAGAGRLSSTNEIGTETSAGYLSEVPECDSPRDEIQSQNNDDQLGIPPGDDDTDNPCIQHRPPTCNQQLYPGVAGSGPAERQ
jgi:hypothetical protein